MTWTTICNLQDIPSMGSRIIKSSKGDIAVFRTGADEVFALFDKCPHKGGPLSQGIVYDKRVTCPLHNWVIELDTGNAVAPDEGCAHSIAVKLEGDKVSLDLDETITAVA